MSNNTATKAPLEEKYNDYEKTPVPETARQTWYQQGMVWLGAGFGLSGLATGGVLADGLSFRDMLLVSIIGSIIITIIGTLNALVSAHTHLSTFLPVAAPLVYRVPRSSALFSASPTLVGTHFRQTCSVQRLLLSSSTLTEALSIL